MQASPVGSVRAIPGKERAPALRRRPSPVLATALSAALLTLALGLLPTSALSQAVRGRVVDDGTNEGVPGVTVTLQEFTRSIGMAITDSLGAFFIPIPGEGRYALEATRIGYATTRSRQFAAGVTDTLTVEFRIHTEAVLLDPLVVTAVAGRGESHFERHRDEWGRGVFITPEMVDSIAPDHPIDILQGQEKTFVRWDWSNVLNEAIPRVRTYRGEGCVAYMVDFHLVLPPRNYVNVGGARGSPGATPRQSSFWESPLLAFLRGRDIVAVEYYRYLGEVPDDLKDRAIVDEDLSGSAWISPVKSCGLVVFWTTAGW